MHKPSILELIAERVPEAERTWVIVALRQDSTVWSELQGITLTGKLRQNPSSLTDFLAEDWSPGALALLSMELAVPVNALRTSAQQVLQDSELDKARQAYQELSSQISAPNLAQSGWAALFGLLVFQQSGSWDNLLAYLQSAPQADWATTIACLYHFSPDPKAFLQALFSKYNPRFMHLLALHALLCNPHSPSEQTETLFGLTTQNGTYQHGLLPYQLYQLLGALDIRQPDLARSYSQYFLATTPVEKLDELSQVKATRCSPNTLASPILLAELHRLAGNDKDAMELISTVQEGTRHLLACLHVKWATIASKPTAVGFQACDPAAEKNLLHASEDSLRQAIALVKNPNSASLFSPFHASLIIHLIEAGNYNEVQATLPPNQELPGTNICLQTALSYLSYQKGNHQDALQFASHAIELLQSSPTAIEDFSQLPHSDQLKAYELLVSICEKLGHYTEAAQVITLQIASSPNNPGALARLSQNYSAAEDHSRALEAIQYACALAPERVDLREQLIRCLEQSQAWADALQERQVMLGILQSAGKNISAQAWLDVAHCAVQAAQPQPALAACQRVLQENDTEEPSSENGRAHLYLGQALAQIGQIDQAVEHLTRATLLAPDLESVWLALSQMQVSQKQLEAALETLRAAAQALPESAALQLALGESYLSGNFLTQASQALRKATQLEPANTQASLLLSQTLLKLGYCEEARTILQQAYERNPAHTHLAYAYGKLLLADGAFEQASQTLENAIRHSPSEDIDMYIELGKAILGWYGQKGMIAHPERAVQVLARVLAIEPDHLVAQALYAEALFTNGEYESALQEYQRLMDTSLSNNKEWAGRLSLGLGRAALALEKHETAIAALQEAVHKEPTNPVAYQVLSDAYLTVNLPDEAYQAARTSTDVAGDDADILMWFADQVNNLYPDQTTGKPASIPRGTRAAAFTQALHALEKAVHIASGRSDVLLRLGQWHQDNGDCVAALEIYRKVNLLETATSIDLHRAGNALLSLDDPQTAIQCLDRSVKMEQIQNGKASTALLRDLSSAYYHIGNLEIAFETIDQALSFSNDDPRLYQQKARLLLEMHRDELALQCLEEGIDNTATHPDSTMARAVASLNRDAARIQRSKGRLAQALILAQEGYHQLQSQAESNPTNLSVEHLELLGLIAELHVALLQPEEAFHTLHLITTQVTVQSAMQQLEQGGKEQNLIGAIQHYEILQAELALEAGEDHKATHQLWQQITNDVQTPGDKLRLAALQTRYAAQAGLEPATEERNNSTLKSAIQYLSEQSSSAFVDQEIPGDYLALVDAAIDLQKWDDALELLSRIETRHPSEPQVYLARARALITRAEFQYLCEATHVVNHAPGDDACSLATQKDILDSLQTANGLLNQFHTESTDSLRISSLDTLPPNPILIRWQGRYQALFSSAAEVVDELHATINRKPGHIFQYSAPDAAAIIAALHRLSKPLNQRQMLKTVFQAARPFPKSPVVLIQLALALAGSNPSEALRTIQQATGAAQQASQPIRAISYTLLARLAFQNASKEPGALLEIAGSAIDTALDLWSEEPRWQALAADICAIRQDYKNTIAHLEAAIRQDPMHLASHLALGKAYLAFSAKDAAAMDRAVAILQRATRIAPEDVTVWHYLAKVQIQASQLEAATRSVQRAMTLAPKNIDLLLLRAEIARRSNDPQAALEYAQQAHEMEPLDTRTAIELSQALQATQKTAEALEILESAIPEELSAEQSNDTLALRIQRAELLRQTQGLDAALEAYKELARNYPAAPQVLINLGRIFAEKNDLASAIAAAQRAVQVDRELLGEDNSLSLSERGEMHASLGHFLRLSGQLDQAIHHLSTAIQLAPDSLETYLELGLARKDRREYGQALQIFQNAVSLAPNDPRPHYQAGLSLREGKDYRAAEDMLRRAASLAPDDVNIRRHLAAVVALNLVHNPRQARVRVE